MVRILLGMTAALLLSGCAVKPDPLDGAALGSDAQARLEQVIAAQAPVEGPIDLYEAMARALKYNLDARVERFEEELRLRTLAVSTQEGLPSLVAGAGYSDRSNVQASTSTYGNPPLPHPVPGNTNFSTSTERDLLTADIGLSWNILDFGLSYVRAKQAADEILIARENRRRVTARIIEDVRTAYWRAVSADRLLGGLRTLEGRVATALDNAAALARDGMSAPLAQLVYRRELLDIREQIQRLEAELSVARAQLAALMNLEPGTPFALAGSTEAARGLTLPLDTRGMVRHALAHRPELREAAYRGRITGAEAERALLELLPGATLFTGLNFDSNAFLYNNSWVDYGARATWNLMSLFRYPARRAEIAARSDLLDQEALALAMAITTQVHVSHARYLQAEKRLKTVAEQRGVQSQILEQIRAAASAEQVSEQTAIREEMNTLVAEVRHDMAYADLQNAYAGLYGVLGADPVEGGFSPDESLDGLAARLRETWNSRGDIGAMVARGGWQAGSVRVTYGQAAPAAKVAAAGTGLPGLYE